MGGSDRIWRCAFKATHVLETPPSTWEAPLGRLRWTASDWEDPAGAPRWGTSPLRREGLSPFLGIFRPERLARKARSLPTATGARGLSEALRLFRPPDPPALAQAQRATDRDADRHEAKWSGATWPSATWPSATWLSAEAPMPHGSRVRAIGPNRSKRRSSRAPTCSLRSYVVCSGVHESRLQFV
jgi:hypothetical protein